MKILNVNFNIGGFAGDTNQIPLVSKALQDMGHEVAIATCDANPFYFDKEKSKQYEIIRKKLVNSTEDNPVMIDNIPVYVTHCTIHQLGMYCPNADSFAKKLVSKYDVVHIYNWYYHLGFVFAKIAYQSDVPFIFSAAGSLLEGAHSLKKTRKQILDILYTKKMLSQSSACDSLGDEETRDYIKWGVDPAKVYRIDNGVDLENFKIKEHTEIFQKIGIEDKNQPYIVFVSRVDKKKGLDLLLRAFAQLQKTQKKYILIIAGTGLPSYEHEMKELAKELGVQNQVKFTGFVTHGEKLELLKESKLFALTSYSDVHPMAILDALTMEAPVLITKACDYPEVEEYDAGKIVDADVGDIHNALIEMLSDENKLQIYSQKAKKLIEEKFLLKNLFKKYEKMYLEVIKNNVISKKH